MEPILYIPHRKKLMQLTAQMTLIAVVFWAVFYPADSTLSWVALGALLLLGLYQLFAAHRFQTFLALDWNGIHIMHAKNGELGCIPWENIALCKSYPSIYDNPSVCVLFQSPTFSVNGTYVYSMEGPIDVKLEGKKILCDRALLKLCRGQITLSDFIRMDGFGITATAHQFERIQAWADHGREDAH